MMNKGEMTVEKAIDVMSDTGFFSPASCYSEEEQLAALYLAIRILEEKAEEEAKMQEEQGKKEKDWAKKPTKETSGYWTYNFCPTCNCMFSQIGRPNFCPVCGQKIDWTN